MSEKEQRLRQKQNQMEKQVDRRDQDVQQYCQNKHQIIDTHQNSTENNR